jgi:hypothetical protein
MDRPWTVVDEWKSFSAQFFLIESDMKRVALKIGANWSTERVGVVADEIRRLGKLLDTDEGAIVTPEVLGLSTDPPALALSFVEGIPLFGSLSSIPQSEMLAHLATCGRAVGIYHKSQPWSAFGQEVPYSLNSLRKISRYCGISEATADRMAKLRCARRYQFSSNDILIGPDGTLILLDPPHLYRYDYVHRDIATALSEVGRNLRNLKGRSQRASNSLLSLAREAFIAGYLGSTGEIALGEDDQKLIGLFEFSRLAGAARKQLRSGKIISAAQTAKRAYRLRGSIRDR